MLGLIVLGVLGAMTVVMVVIMRHAETLTSCPGEGEAVMDTPHLIYFADPMCSWCYGFGPELRKLLDVATADRYPPIDLASVDIAERGKTYLHVNCSMCHRPGGGGVVTSL